MAVGSGEWGVGSGQWGVGSWQWGVGSGEWAGFLGEEGFEGGDVGGGEVADVDVVAHAGAVGGGIVVAEDAEFGSFADGDLSDVGHEVVRDAVGVFADETGGVGADGVEVAEEDDAPLVVGVLDVGQDLFEHALGPAVGVGAEALGTAFGDGDFGGVAVDGGAGAEDDVFAVVTAHDVEEGEGATDVVFVVFPRFFDAFADGFKASEVDAGVEVVVGEDLFQGLTVADVDGVEGDLAAGSGERGAGGGGEDFLDAAEGDGVAVAEVVDDDGGVAGEVEFDQGVGADEAGASGDEDVHGVMFYG